MATKTENSRRLAEPARPSDDAVDRSDRVELANATLRYLQLIASHVVASFAEKPRN